MPLLVERFEVLWFWMAIKRKTIPKSNGKILEKGKIDTPSSQIHNHSEYVCFKLYLISFSEKCRFFH